MVQMFESINCLLIPRCSRWKYCSSHPVSSLMVVQPQVSSQPYNLQGQLGLRRQPKQLLVVQLEQQQDWPSGNFLEFTKRITVMFFCSIIQIYLELAVCAMGLKVH